MLLKMLRCLFVYDFYILKKTMWKLLNLF
uniref:Uncharacterized protein n=1 Tax=Anguilla anguilla TaxID=7936 RepID=A0A0E9W3J5_ANGAN